MKRGIVIGILAVLQTVRIFAIDISSEDNSVEVTIYRPSNSIGSAADMEIFINQDVIFVLDQMEYINFRCSPGEYLIYFIPKIRDFQSNSGAKGVMLAEFESGNQYIIELGIVRNPGLIPIFRPGGTFVRSVKLEKYSEINSFRKIEEM